MKTSILIAKAFNKLYFKKLQVYSACVSIYVQVLVKLKGVKLGKNSVFFGFPFFYRRFNSSISIGSHCTFRSKATSNLIGINRPCMISTIHPNSKITIGNNCGFSGTVIGAFISIQIGNDVMCGANTLITDSDWHLNDPRSGPPRPIIINDNVWIGEGAKVLKGVTIGENSVVGAGSVVAKDIPANVIAGGNPCKIIKEL